MLTRNEFAPPGDGLDGAQRQTEFKVDSSTHHAAVNSPLLELRPDNIPTALRVFGNRFAPWEAVQRPGKFKFDKVPRTLRIVARASTKHAWWSFERAMHANDDSLGVTAGIGFLLTVDEDAGLPPHGIVALDLDHCVSGGVVASWAQEIISRANSYAELSPSGSGVRVFLFGVIARDWVDIDQGIEVYGGHGGRYVTVTGHRLPDTPADIQPAPDGFFEWLEVTYQKTPAQPAAVCIDMPELLPEGERPALEDLELSPQVQSFLDGGPVADRSKMVAATTRALYEATASPDGTLRDDVVLSLLVSLPAVWEVATEHRPRTDDGKAQDAAIDYLWKHHCLKARGSVSPAINDFEAIDEPKEQAKRFTPVPAHIFAAGEAAGWIIKSVLLQAGLCVLFGESGSGKSFFVLDQVLAIARGIPWRGHKVQQGSVVYIAAEGAGGFRRRLTAYAQHHSIDLASVPLMVIADVPNLLQGDDKLLAERINAAGGASVIVIDTLAQTTAGANENAGEDMGRVIAHCQRLHRVTGALVILVHHAGKDVTRGARGWSGIRAAADVEIEISRTDGRRFAKVSKCKDGEDGAVFGFNLLSVTIGIDDDGDDVTSCIVEAVEGAPVAPQPRPQGPWEHAVHSAIVDLLPLDGGSVAVEDVIAEAAGRQPRDPEKRDRRREYAMRAIRSLAERAIICVQENAITLPRAASMPHEATCGMRQSPDSMPHMPHHPLGGAACGTGCGG